MSTNMVDSFQLSALSFQLSAFGLELWAFDFQLSVPIHDLAMRAELCGSTSFDLPGLLGNSIGVLDLYSR